ncbi:META domain-containing protein [Streptomyces sp. NPDC057877]|uniref:META domain-containing protein n=1 Tax=Streptomyces sp. NPDC057877 TaxID=3346269 RepID=UPI0036893DF5
MNVRPDEERGTVSGADGCNHFRGGTETDEAAGTVTFNTLTSTAIACYDDFARYFPRAEGPLRIGGDAARLVLTGADGDGMVLRATQGAAR